MFAFSIRPASAGDLVFRRHVLNADSEFVAAAAIDVNRDGRLDVVCGAFWYEAPNWTKHDVRTVEIINGRPDGYAHIPLDVNGDGWTDVLSANWRSSSIRWTEHPGKSLGEWPVHTIAEPGPMETARLYDVDGDGRLDVLPAGARFAAWWSLSHESDDTGQVQPVWRRYELPAEVAGHGIGCGDIDGDGRADVVAQFGWASAPEHPRTQPWEFHADFRLDRASVPILVVDVDQDGDNDLVWCRAHDFGVYWSEQQRGERGVSRWKHHPIDASWSGGHSPLWIDMDGDGRSELVVGKRYLAHEGRDPGEYDPQYGYRYQYQPSTRTWKRWPLSVGEGVGYGLDPKAVDLDADGDLDLLCGGRNGLYWLENQGPPSGQRDAVARDQPAAPSYDDSWGLLTVKEMTGEVRPVVTPFDWGMRRTHILAEFEAIVGRLPSPEARVPLDVEATIGEANEAYERKAVQFTVRAGKRVAAHLFVPKGLRRQAPAVLIAPGSTPLRKEEDRGADSIDALALADDLARRGFVCLAPDFSWSNEYRDETYVRHENHYPAPSMQTVWSHIRAVDLLDTFSEVDSLRIGIAGQGAGGAAGLLAAALDQRINAVAIVIAPSDLPIDLAGALATVAPRPMLVRAPDSATSDEIAQLRDAVEAAREVYEFRSASEALSQMPESSDDGGSGQDHAWVCDWMVGNLW